MAARWDGDASWLDASTAQVSQPSKSFGSRTVVRVDGQHRHREHQLTVGVGPCPVDARDADRLTRAVSDAPAHGRAALVVRLVDRFGGDDAALPCVPGGPVGHLARDGFAARVVGLAGPVHPADEVGHEAEDAVIDDAGGVVRTVAIGPSYPCASLRSQAALLQAVDRTARRRAGTAASAEQGAAAVLDTRSDRREQRRPFLNTHASVRDASHGPTYRLGSSRCSAVILYVYPVFERHA